MSEHVGTARVGRRPQVGGEPSAADWLAHADPLSIMYWVDDVVAEYVARPELPGRDAVITRATDLRGLCRELVACRRRLAGLPAPRRGNVLRFRGGSADRREAMTARGREASGGASRSAPTGFTSRPAVGGSGRPG